MATLYFTPRTTIDANVFQHRLDNSPYHAEWNVRTGAYEFEIEEWEADELEDTISQELAYDINGRFEFLN